MLAHSYARRRVRSVLFARAVAIATLLFVGAVQLSAQAATVGGTVLADSSERPLANAEVSFPLLGRSTRSDSVGNFLLANIKPGRQRFRIRLVGYESLESWLVIDNKQRLDADFLLKPVTTKLATVNIKTNAGSIATVRAQEFEENQNGTGRYIKADVFEKEQGRSLANIIATRVAGLTTVKRAGTEEYLSSSRDTNRGCFTQVLLNGLVVYRGGMQLFNINSIAAMDVIGVEYYTTSTTPAKYLGMGAGCGTIVIWTK